MNTDRERLRLGFAKLRKLGWYARMNYWCCQTCGNYDAFQQLQKREVPPEERNVVFWHNQDNEAFDGYGNLPPGSVLHLTHSGNSRPATEVVEVLTSVGLNVCWPGQDQGRRIEVRTAA